MEDEKDYRAPYWPPAGEVTGKYLRMPANGAWVDVVVIAEAGEFDDVYEGKPLIKTRLVVNVKEGAGEPVKKNWDVIQGQKPYSPVSAFGQLALIRNALNNLKGIKSLAGQRLRISNVGANRYKVFLLNAANDIDSDIMETLQ